MKTLATIVFILFGMLAIIVMFLALFDISKEDERTRWGQYDFCKGCKYESNGKCNRMINDQFPKQCAIPERQELENHTQNKERKW